MSAEHRRFVEQSSWNAFGVGLAGVVAVLLLVFMFSTPVCTLGLPWLPMLMTGSVTLHEKSDLRVAISREGFAIIGTNMVRNRDIERALGDVLIRIPYKRIVVAADRRVSYGALQPIFRVAQSRGLPVVFVSGEVSVLGQSEAEARFNRTRK